jgi:hypothetical protein
VSNGFWNSPSPKLASHWLNRERSTAGGSAPDSPAAVPGDGSCGVALPAEDDGSEAEGWFMLFGRPRKCQVCQWGRSRCNQG